MLLALGIPFLNEIVLLFLIAVAIAYICHRLKLVPIVGFLIAGVVIGPNALSLVPDQELVDILAEIGVILLLFTIGIEFSFEKLNRIKKAIVFGGGLQVGLTTAIVVGILAAFGIGIKVGIYTGFLVTLSSTAIVLGLLSQRGETDSSSGKLSLAVLIFQDLAIIFMVLAIPILSGESKSALDVALVLGKAIGLVIVVILLARKVVPWILEYVARSRKQELFLLTVITICFGIAALTSMADVSLALGAFLAGLVVSESNFSDQALSEILPLRTVFNAVFFVSVGMLLDVRFVIQNPLLLLAVAAGVILLKLIITSTSLLALGYPIRIASAAGLALAQIGEFSFVLERAGRPAGLTPAGLGDDGSQVFIAVSVLLMILTPFMLNFSERLGGLMMMTPLRHLGTEPEEAVKTKKLKLEDHVIIVGYGPAGRNLVNVLSQSSIPFIVIEMNPGSVSEMREEEIPAIYGDGCRRHILELAGIMKAKMLVLATNDPYSTPKVIHLARYLNPITQIVVRTRFMRDVEPLTKRGADIVIPEELETTVRIFEQVLGSYMLPTKEIEKHISNLRANDYQLIRGSIQEAHLMVLQGLDEEGMHTRAVVVRENSEVAHKSLMELDLRNRYSLTVLTVKRGERSYGNPKSDFVLEPGDRLVMIGEADRFAECAGLFRVGREDELEI